MTVRTLYLWDVPTDVRETDILQAFASLKPISVKFDRLSADDDTQQVALQFQSEADLLQSSDKPVELNGHAYKLAAVPKMEGADVAGGSATAEAIATEDLLDEYLSLLDDTTNAIPASSPTTPNIPDEPPFVCYILDLSANVGFADLAIFLQAWKSIGFTMPKLPEMPASVTFGSRDDLAAFLSKQEVCIAGETARVSLAQTVAPACMDTADSDSENSTNKEAEMTEIQSKHATDDVIDSKLSTPLANDEVIDPEQLLPASTETTPIVDHSQQKEFNEPANKDDDAIPIDSVLDASPTVPCPIESDVQPKEEIANKEIAPKRIIHPINTAEIPFYPPFQAYIYGLAKNTNLAELFGNTKLLSTHRYADEAEAGTEWACIEFGSRKELLAIVQQADRFKSGDRTVGISLTKLLTSSTSSEDAMLPLTLDYSMKPLANGRPAPAKVCTNGAQSAVASVVEVPIRPMTPNTFVKPRSTSVDTSKAADKMKYPSQQQTAADNKPKKWWPKKNTKPNEGFVDQRHAQSVSDDPDAAPFRPNNHHNQPQHFNPYQNQAMMNRLQQGHPLQHGPRFGAPHFGPPPHGPHFGPQPNFNRPLCVFCDQNADMACGRCATPYCSARCQLVDWSHHSRKCAEMPILVPREHFQNNFPPLTINTGPIAQPSSVPTPSPAAASVGPVANAAPKPTAPINKAQQQHVKVPAAAEKLKQPTVNGKPSTPVVAAVDPNWVNPFKKKPATIVTLDSKRQPTPASVVTHQSRALDQVVKPAAATAVVPAVVVVSKPTPPAVVINPVAIPQPIASTSPIRLPVYQQMLCERITVPYCDMPAPNTIVCITEVIKPDCCFIRPNDPTTTRQYNDVIEAIRNYSAKTAKPLRDVPVLGQVILAPHSKLKFLCRALVLRVNNPSDGTTGTTLAVAFIDYGCLAVVPLAQCTDLARQLQHLMRYVHRVSVRAGGAPLEQLSGKRLRMVYDAPFAATTQVELIVEP